MAIGREHKELLNDVRTALAALILSIGVPSAHAITWREKTIPDPLDAGKTCAVHEPASYGSYIYEWESKYDQVFWPLIDPNGIWFCEHSGFTAFIGDVKDMTSPQKAAIRAWLKQNCQGDRSIQGQLRLLEGIYALRGRDEEFRNRLLRVLARWHQSLGDADAADRYRRRAFDGIKAALESKLDDRRSLEYLYLAANYARLFGDVQASDRYLATLSAKVTQIKGDELKGYAGYLADLAKVTPSIKPGRVLDPAGTAIHGNH